MADVVQRTFDRNQEIHSPEEDVQRARISRARLVCC